MKAVTVNASNSYDILIEKEILWNAGKYIKRLLGDKKLCIVTDDTVDALYSKPLEDSLKSQKLSFIKFVIPHGEASKNASNLISLLETGRDLGGREVPSLLDAFERADCRLVIIPVYNIDGRARCVPDSMIGEPPESLRYHGQGTWRDGSLCGWPDCKKIHPIRDAAGFLGAYYNDDGVNLRHDNFFAPMAPETAALLRLADAEAPECVIGLHGGSNSTNELLQPSYTTLENRKAVHRLAEAVAALQTAHGLKSHVHPVRETAEGTPPPSFNLTTAIYHVCGAVTSTYESNEGLIANNQFTAEEILLHHYCLFESMLALAWRE
jgi:hypothetical protein